MLSESAEKLVGNDAFEGYAIDLIAEIAEILKFNYTFKWVDDGAYGYKNKETGEWNGLMGELLSQVNINIPRIKSDDILALICFVNKETLSNIVKVLLI